MARSKARIVVIGGGFGGAYCAQKLERLFGPAEAEIILLDRHNYFIFYPLLIEAGTGSLEPRHAVVSIRSFLKRAEFRMAEVTGLDPEAGEVLCRTADGRVERVGYDHLVVALGSAIQSPPVPGLAEYGLQIKSIPQAVALRDRAILMLEIADITPSAPLRDAALRFVVVGANFTGTEVAGELDAVLLSAVREYPNVRRSDIRITLIDRGDRILPALDRGLSEYAATNLRRRGIDLRLGESVSELREDSVLLRSGERLPTRTVIWAAGIAPPPVVARLGLPLDERGYIVCERDLRVKGFDNVWGIGDCAVNTDADGQPYPATAQHAVREGVHAAKNIRRVLRGRPALPCDLASRGALAALGCRTGVAHVLGFNIAGFLAWWLWRTVYLIKMPGLGRKLQVALEWTVGLFFRRQYVQLGIHAQARPAGGRPERSEWETPAGDARPHPSRIPAEAPGTP